MRELNQLLELKDSRKLAFAQFGDNSGYPIIYCHGSQSSRLEMHYDMDFAHQLGIMIITIDRPGHGLSDFNSRGSILSFADDVEQLTQHLGFNQFSVAGMSAGSPFALGIASKYPDKVNKVAIISGFAPFNKGSSSHLSKEVKTLLNVAKSFPFMLKILLKVQSRQLKNNPKKALHNFLKIMSEPDQKVLENNAVMMVIENMFKEAFRNGSKGVAHEISKILVKDWGFDLSKVSVPIQFHQGELDNNVPYQWARLMQNQIPGATLKEYPNEGHLIIFNHAAEIFGGLRG